MRLPRLFRARGRGAAGAKVRADASKDEALGVEFYEPTHGLDVEAYIEREEKQGIHHLGRYHWATGVLAQRKPRAILDIACGAGFGSKIVATRMPDAEVLGADYDSRAVELARRTYAAPNLRYAQGNVVTWERIEGETRTPLGRYDAIVSFDTVEHLLFRELAFLRMADNLTDDGALLLSTPCHQLAVLNPGWEHHKIEYAYDDLKGLLARFFRRVLVPEDRSLPNFEFWDDVINAGRRRYATRTNPVVCLEPVRV